MGHYDKPGIAWAEIQRRFEAGETAYALGQEYPVSRQGIEKRARKEGWLKPTGRYAEAVKDTSTAVMARDPQTPRDKRVVSYGKRSPENMALILERLEIGASLRVAAGSVGISPDTLSNWLADDAEFRSLADAARHEAAMKKIRRVDDAGERGDWKADMAMLERMEVTKEEYGRSDNGGAPAISITLNLGAPTVPATIRDVSDEGRVIEGSAANAA